MGIMSGLGIFGLMGGIGLLFNIALWGGLIWLVVWGVRQFSNKNRSPTNTIAAPKSPREILAARYARGELTRDEYQTTLHDLA